jgi:hypothetical protein
MGDAISSPFSAAFGRYSRTLYRKLAAKRAEDRRMPPPTPKAK